MDQGELLAAIVLNNDLWEAEEQNDQPPRKILRRENALQMPNRRFIRFFRADKTLARELIDLLEPHLGPPSRQSALNAEIKVLTALKFFGMGSYQEITGTNSYIGISQASTSRCIRDVCQALNRPEIFNSYVRFPQHNIRELQALRRRFYEKYAFQGVVGCVGETHVAIVSPKRQDDEFPEHIYVNRKNYHSINVQWVCDENLRIISVNARFRGSSHDAHVWRESNISRVMEEIYRRNNSVFFFLGDSGYPLRPWLQTPLREVQAGTPEERYNTALKSVRSKIECCNGVLKNRFRCLLRHRVLHYAPDVAGKIINACTVLHNMCIDHNIPGPDYDAEVVDADFGMYEPIVAFHEADNNVNLRNVNPDLAAGRALQRSIIQNHFN